MKRRTFLMTLPASGLALAMAKNSLAHHGWSSFDESKPIYLEGKVKSTKWQNPHAEIMITLATDLKLPADLAKRTAPAQTNPVDGAKVLSNAVLPKKRGDWELELSPMTRIEAWKVSEPKVGDTIAAVGFTFKDEKGASIARIEYLIVGDKIYGLRSMPA
jgi:Family of unknown function (DUF6152)